MSPDTRRGRVRCLKVKDWPAMHRTAWERATAPAELFAARNIAHGWRETSRNKTAKGYGAWLDWCLGHPDLGHAIPESAPGAFVTRETVRAYLDDLAARGVSTSTCANRVQELHDALEAMAPDSDWSWLSRAFRNLYSAARPVRDKAGRLKDLPDLEKLGTELMEEARTAPPRDYRQGEGLTALQRALSFRDGLIIALLCRRPLRIRNLADLALGENLFLDPDGIGIAFAADAMKGKRPLDVPFPPDLVPALEHYLEEVRPVLLTASAKAPGTPIDDLWVSRDGTALSEVSLHKAVCRRTRAEFGDAIPPHWFRDAAATFVALKAPAAAGIIRDVLGHASLNVATRHYNHAGTAAAARRYADVMADLLDEPAPRSPS